MAAYKNKRTGKVYHYNVKFYERHRVLSSVLIVVFIVAFFLQFDWMQKLLQPIFPNVDWNQVSFYASVATWSALGVLLLQTAAITSAVPFVGIGFAVIGGIVLVTQAIRVINKNSSGKITGLGPFSSPE